MMKCPHCGVDNNDVTDSRLRDGCQIRIRHCFSCGQKFTTREELSTSRRDRVTIKAMPEWAKRRR